MKPQNSLMFLGILLIILGILSLFSPAFAGSALVLTIGGIMLVAGIAQFIHGLREESWKQRVFPLVLGVITGLCGALVLGHPLLGLGFLTILLILFFVTEGIWKIAVSFSYRPASGWVAMLIGGVASLVLGLIIWKQWPVSGLWAVGILIGVDFTLTGIAMVVLATTLRRLAPA